MKSRNNEHWSNLEQQMPVNFQIFKENSHYQEAMEKIINDICMGNQDAVNSVQCQDSELYELLLKDFYIKYFTNQDVRKYVNLRLKENCPEEIRVKMLQELNDFVGMEESDLSDDIEIILEDPIIIEKNLKVEKNPEECTINWSGTFSDEFLFNYLKMECSNVFERITLIQVLKQLFPNVTDHDKETGLEIASDNELNEIKKALLVNVPVVSLILIFLILI